MKHQEEDLQQSCVRWFDYEYPSLRHLLHHSPNGGRRTLREAARFKSMGTKAGFPDLILCMAARGYHGLFIEMKSEKGTQTALQKTWQTALEEQGYRYVVCRSFDDFKRIINTYVC